MQRPPDTLPPPRCPHQYVGQRKRATWILSGDIVGQRRGQVPPPGRGRPERHPGRVPDQIAPTAGLSQHKAGLAPLDPEALGKQRRLVIQLVRRVGVDLGMKAMQVGRVRGCLRAAEQLKRHVGRGHDHLPLQPSANKRHAGSSNEGTAPVPAPARR